ncbi:MAG TPA: cysteine peptidase family C39 domain-containing protein, partial [Candidatus Omnitrophota bacterium]|nr:cysteine peptidase family C39 domain-containing protein [Candidatus Omnitrophota bacterium]
MSDKIDNYDLPGSWMVPYETPSREGLKTFPSAKDISAPDIMTYDSVNGSDQAPAFRSRFSGWLRTVALIVVLVFLPEQVSWAFNYNPGTIWGSKDQPVVSVAPDASNDEIVSARIAASVNHLLNQVAYREKTRVQLQLSNNAIANPELGKRDLFIDSDTVFTKSRIRRITEWLQAPDIHPLNCGVYALKDILSGFDVDASLEELSVSSLMVDLLSDIVRPGEEKLKTSLFAISKIVDAYGLDLKSAKLAPADVLRLKTPFIANFGSEHFVTVNKIDGDQVQYSDIGSAQVSPKQDFISQLSGFVLAPDLEEQKDIAFEYVPDSMTPFIWGNKWISKADDLPGMYSTGSLVLNFVVSVGMSIIGGYLGSIGGGGVNWSGVFGGLSYSFGSNSFTETLYYSEFVKCANAGGDAGDCADDAAATTETVSTWLSIGGMALSSASGGAHDGHGLLQVILLDFGVIGIGGGWLSTEVSSAVTDWLDDLLPETMDSFWRELVISSVSSLAASVTFSFVSMSVNSIADGFSASDPADIAAGDPKITFSWETVGQTFTEGLADLGISVAAQIGGQLASLGLRWGLSELGKAIWKGENEDGTEKANRFALDSQFSQVFGALVSSAVEGLIQKAVVSHAEKQAAKANIAKEEAANASTAEGEENVAQGSQDAISEAGKLAADKYIENNANLDPDSEAFKAGLKNAVARAEQKAQREEYRKAVKEELQKIRATRKLANQLKEGKEAKENITVGDITIDEGDLISETDIAKAKTQYVLLMESRFGNEAEARGNAAAAKHQGQLDEETQAQQKQKEQNANYANADGMI